VPNRKGGQNLKDNEGYVYQRTKTSPLKDFSTFNPTLHDGADLKNKLMGVMVYF
jgi:hypothetical protein